MRKSHRKSGRIPPHMLMEGSMDDADDFFDDDDDDTEPVYCICQQVIATPILICL
jgi:hypothetical protein